MGAVGFVGLGNIGKPMATRLLAWPDGLHAYDVAQGPIDELAAAGASVAGSVGELAGAVDLLCVMVRDDDQVREVLDQAPKTARPGLTVAIHPTVAPDTHALLSAPAREPGAHAACHPHTGT